MAEKSVHGFEYQSHHLFSSILTTASEKFIALLKKATNLQCNADINLIELYENQNKITRPLQAKAMPIQANIVDKSGNRRLK